MLTKFNKILIGLLVAQLALVVLTFARSGEPGVAKEAPLLAGFDAAKVTRVQVFAGGDPDKAAVDLVRRDAGWVLASHFDHPVDAVKLTDVLAPLGKMAAAEPLATQASRHKQLKVGERDFERKLVITADGKDTTVYIGTSAGTRRVAVRLGTTANVYGVTGVSAYTAGTEARSWAQARYFEIAKADVEKIVIQRGATAIDLERGEGDKWSAAIDGAPLAPAAGEVLDTAAIDDLVNALAAIDLVEPADPKRDASAPAATVTIHRKAPPPAADGTLTPAAVPAVLDLVADGERYWVRARGNERAVLVDKARLAKVVDLDRAKLVTKPDAAPPADPGGATPPIPDDIPLPPDLQLGP